MRQATPIEPEAVKILKALQSEVGRYLKQYVWGLSASHIRERITHGVDGIIGRSKHVKDYSVDVHTTRDGLITVHVNIAVLLIIHDEWVLVPLTLAGQP